MDRLRVKIVALYVDRTNRQWVLRDIDGNLWTFAQGCYSWDERIPYEENEASELEVLPTHYLFMTGIHS